MEPDVRTFLQRNHAAAMITLRKDGTPHAVRVGVGLHEEKLWSSGTQTRLRTRHLRHDARCTFFVFDSQEAGGWRWLTLEGRVDILDGPDAAQLNLEFFQSLQAETGMADQSGKLLWFGREVNEEEFLQAMRNEQRLIYEFTIERSYGMFGGLPAA